MITLSAAGATGLLLPTSLAYADTGSQEVATDSMNTLATSVGCIITGDSAVDENNKYAFDLWNEAVKKAYAENSEIITIVNPKPSNEIMNESMRGSYTVSTNEKHFTTGLWISIHYYLAATYDVNSSNQVSGFRYHNGYLTYGLYNPTLSLLGYSTAIIDGGRTYAVHSTFYTSCTVAGVLKSAQFQTYSEFYYNGTGYLY